MIGPFAAVIPVIDERDAIEDVVSGLRPPARAACSSSMAGPPTGRRCRRGRRRHLVVEPRRGMAGPALRAAIGRLRQPHPHEAVVFLDGDGSCDGEEMGRSSRRSRPPTSSSAVVRATDSNPARCPGTLAWATSRRSRALASVRATGARPAAGQGTASRHPGAPSPGRVRLWLDGPVRRAGPRRSGDPSQRDPGRLSPASRRDQQGFGLTAGVREGGPVDDPRRHRGDSSPTGHRADGQGARGRPRQDPPRIGPRRRADGGPVVSGPGRHGHQPDGRRPRFRVPRHAAPVGRRDGGHGHRRSGVDAGRPARCGPGCGADGSVPGRLRPRRGSSDRRRR